MPDLLTFRDGAALGDFAAEWIWQRLMTALRTRGVAVLGCPSGRSPRSTYAALARLAAAHDADLSGLHLVMMDEFIARGPGGWERWAASAHYSCARFGEVEIRWLLNDGLPVQRTIPAAQLHLPDPRNPAAYEDLIDRLGGIDVFILASGASDGHVAFNPPGSGKQALTRVVRLAEATRRDNLATFPDFRTLAEVPEWGVTVGPGTIARASRSAVMILIGADKHHAFRRLVSARGYETDWPATIVHACADSLILADKAAAGPA